MQVESAHEHNGNETLAFLPHLMGLHLRGARSRHVRSVWPSALSLADASRVCAPVCGCRCLLVDAFGNARVLKEGPESKHSRVFVMSGVL